MNDLTMCLKWRASGALATVRSRLCLRVFPIKFKATPPPRKWQRCGDSPKVTLWWTRRSISAVDFSGEIVTDPPPLPTVILLGPYQWWPNAGSLIEAQWRRSADRICTLARAKQMLSRIFQEKAVSVCVWSDCVRNPTLFPITVTNNQRNL